MNKLYVVKTPDRRYAKVHKDNLDKVPKNWTIYKNRECITFYKKNGSLNRKFSAVKQLRSTDDFKDFYKPYKTNLGLLFGTLKEM